MSNSIADFMNTVKVPPPMHRPRLDPARFANQPNVMAFRQMIFDREKRLGNIAPDAVLDGHVRTEPLAKVDAEVVRTVVSVEAVRQLAVKKCTPVVHTSLCGVFSGEDMEVTAREGVASYHNGGSAQPVEAVLPAGAVNVPDMIMDFEPERVVSDFERARELRDACRRRDEVIARFEALPPLRLGEYSEDGYEFEEFTPVGRKVGAFAERREAQVFEKLLPVQRIDEHVDETGGSVLARATAVAAIVGERLALVGEDAGPALLVRDSGLPPEPVEATEGLSRVGARRVNKVDETIYRLTWESPQPVGCVAAVPLELSDGWLGAFPPGLGLEIKDSLQNGKKEEVSPLRSVVHGLLESPDGFGSAPGSAGDMHEVVALRHLVEAGYARFLAMCRSDTSESFRRGRFKLHEAALAAGRSMRENGSAGAVLDGHTHVAVFEPVLQSVPGESLATVGRFGYVRRIAVCVPNASLVSVLRCLDWAVLERYKRHVFVEHTFSSEFIFGGVYAPRFSVLPRGLDMSAVGALEKLVSELFLSDIGVPHQAGCEVCGSAVAARQFGGTLRGRHWADG